MYGSRIGSSAPCTSARTRASTSRGPPARDVATKLIEERDRRRLARRAAARARRACARSAREPDSASIVFQFRCVRRGVSPTSGLDHVRERRLQRVALVARIPDEGEPTARLQHSMDLSKRRSASNQWNAAATVTPSTAAVGERIRRRCPRARRPPARAARARRASRGAGSTATTFAPLGTSRRVSLLVPAARSSTVRPGRSSSFSTMRAIAAAGIVRPAALVHVGRGEAARCGMELRHGARSRRSCSSESARCPARRGSEPPRAPCPGREPLRRRH